VVFSSDLKVRVEASDLSAFPDASVVCGPPQCSPIDSHAITNPTVLVEVTSPSTEDYDRGEKLSHYKQLPALQAVLFVSHRTRRVTVVSRAGTGWEEREVRAGEHVQLESPALRISIDELYAGVALDPA
jgi:Uma2 family endonuclease